MQQKYLFPKVPKSSAIHQKKTAKSDITHLALGQSPKKLKHFKGHKNPFGQEIYNNRRVPVNGHCVS